MHMPDGSDERRLDALLGAYRRACPDPEASANFMPLLWQRIEARQTPSFFLGRMARAFVTAAVALTLAMAVYLYLPHGSGVFYSESYVEALASGHSADNPDFYEAVHLDEAEGQL
jgi:hypothetical protein